MARDLVPDDTAQVASRLVAWADGGVSDVILTTGGTGLSATDRTPEATRAVLDIEAPGIAEFIRNHATPTFPRAALSRGLAGARAAALIVNLPGSTRGVTDGLAALDHILPHAVDIVRGRTDHA